jgi:hypothetical protein
LTPARRSGRLARSTVVVACAETAKGEANAHTATIITERATARRIPRL